LHGCLQDVTDKGSDSGGEADVRGTKTGSGVLGGVVVTVIVGLLGIVPIIGGGGS
jgi:hypothetical protein